jgi:membrane protease YdiL (CAAX protease family)
MQVWKKIFGWITWQRVPISEFKIMQPERELAIGLAFAVSYVVAAALVSQVILLKPLPILGSADFTTDAWYDLVLKIGLLLILPVVWFFGQGYRLADLMPNWSLQPRTLLSIVIAFLLGVSVNAGLLDFIRDAAASFSTGELAIRIGAGVILPLLIAGLPEELVYRGFLHTRLERRFGRIVAIVLTALLFTAWHLPSRFFLAHGVEGSAGNLASVLAGTGIPVFFFGMLFSLYWDRYRSLPPLIAVHWGIDLLPILASLLGVHY